MQEREGTERVIIWGYKGRYPVAEVRGAGEAWEGHARTYRYLQNDTSDTLRCNRYSVDADGKPVKQGLYADNMLQVVREADEDGHVAYTFTDMLGRTVLERRMDGTEPHDTYYIYDLYGQLRCVLPPMCEGECGDDVLEKYAFQYEYDNRGHVVEKKLPGASPVKYTYDEAGHLTYEQSGNQVLEHTVYLYDRHGRLAVQGKYRPKFSLGDGPKSVLPELKGETWYCIPLWHSGTSMALGTRYADIGYLLTYYVPLSINPGIGLAAHHEFDLGRARDTHHARQGGADQCALLRHLCLLLKTLTPSSPMRK